MSETLGTDPGGQRESLSRRIAVGFAIVLALHVIVAVMSHVGLDRAEETSEYSTSRHEAVRNILSIDRKVVALQRNVLAFMDTGDRNLAEDVVGRLDDLDRALSESRLEWEHRQDSIQEMAAALAGYRAEFDKVVAERGTRERTLSETILPLLEETRESLEAAARAGFAREDAKFAAEVTDVLALLDDAKRAMFLYLIRPDGATAREFEQRIAAGIESLEGLDLQDTPSTEPSELLAIADDLRTLRTEVLGVVAATRSYLHLVDVVLAGQAREFLTLSRAFTEEVVADQSASDSRAAAAQRRFATTASIVGLLTVIAGIIAGVRIGRSITRPIASLTRTFSRLAQGQEAEIEGRDRGDEIGEMARAAEVFAQRNRETSDLLEAATVNARVQHELNESLERHVKELERRNDDLDRFSYSASHDLRSPLRAIALLAEWIEDDAGGHLPPESQEHLTKLRSRTERMEKLLDGLLDYSRIGRTEDLSEELDVVKLAQDAADSLMFDDRVTIKVSGGPAKLTAPRVAVEKVLLNLISNAIKHHDGDDPRIDVRIADEGAVVRMEVEDDGPGIPEELHGKVFQMFQTVRTRDEHESSGIGLAIVRKLCVEHGATVSVHSNGERGSVFTVVWPITYVRHPLATQSPASAG